MDNKITIYGHELKDLSKNKYGGQFSLSVIWDNVTIEADMIMDDDGRVRLDQVDIPKQIPTEKRYEFVQSLKDLAFDFSFNTKLMEEFDFNRKSWSQECAETAGNIGKPSMKEMMGSILMGDE